MDGFERKLTGISLTANFHYGEKLFVSVLLWNEWDLEGFAERVCNENDDEEEVKSLHQVAETLMKLLLDMNGDSA